MSKAGHCWSCKHWLGFEEAQKDPRGQRSYGACGAAHRLGLCQLASKKADTPAHPLVLCEDASDYTANLRTAADFGCVLWEKL